MMKLDRCYNISDLREAARRRLPHGVFEYLDRGSEDELALTENLQAFRRLRLRTRVLKDLTERRLDTTLFGKPMSLPLAIVPTGSPVYAGTKANLHLPKRPPKRACHLRWPQAP
jgi:(S)-mandelate dehydrogenase